MQTRTYGTWESPLSAPALVAGARGFSELALDGDTLYWVESRPDEGGRQVLMRRLADGTTEELTGPEFNVRSRVHEYGGGAFSVANGIAYFTNFSDQTLFRLAPGKAPLALGNGGLRRYADCAVDSERQRLICVMEDHSREGEPSNTLIALDATGPSDPIPLFTESDFVASPALSSDGRYLAFIAWNHPNLPWDDTFLYIIELDANGEARKTRRINPGQHEAIMAPQWGPDGKLYVISDRDNWWNFYRLQGQELVQFTHAELEFGRPAWVFNNRLYGFLPDGDILALTNHRGREGLARVTRNTGAVQKLYLGLAETRALVVGSDKAFFVAGFPAATGGIVEFDWTAPRLTMIRASQSLALPITAISKGEAIAFPSGEGETAYGFFYPPKNPNFQGPADARPPLLVLVHGGPTSHATPGLNNKIQFWTTRGFAVLDLNYRGSTGFGRAFRHSLNLAWGDKDVADAVKGARYLAKTGRADPEKLLIRGGSAGGFTVLAAHAFYDVFAAGASYYGVSDMEALAQDTHKFEARYLDQLVGPYPEQQTRYRKRSPIHHLEGFTKPLIVLQGEEDKIVPPSQSEAIVEALKTKGIPVSYLSFPGEQHGFRKAETIIRAIEAELAFYGRVLGFTPR